MEETIEREAKRLLDAMKDGMLYGIPVDITDINHVVVSAYYMAKAEAHLDRIGTDRITRVFEIS